MSLVTAGTDCTVSQHIWDVVENCSIARDQQLQKLCYQRSVSASFEYIVNSMFADLWLQSSYYTQCWPDTMFTIRYGMPRAWLKSSALDIISTIISHDLPSWGDVRQNCSTCTVTSSSASSSSSAAASLQTEYYVQGAYRTLKVVFQDFPGPFMSIFHIFPGLCNRVDIKQVRFSYNTEYVKSS